jgi:N6-adenosine-specific RNA methylase IME4
MKLPDKKYSIILADPPWNYKDNKGNIIGYGSASAHYDTMKTQDIVWLPIRKITDNNCILFCWVTFPCLIDGLRVIKGWGFEYKTIGFCWIKTVKKQSIQQTSFLPYDIIDSFFGIGHYTKSNCEVCLIGIKGKPEIISNKVSSVVFEPRGEHSKKPDIVRQRIVELCGDKPRIELFARQKVNGWDSWGLEI